VQGDLAVRGAQDLALTDAESQQLLSDLGAEVSLAEASHINRACAGWVSGLVMCAMIASADREAPDLVVPAAHSQLVDDYLRVEVLEQLTPEEQDFIRHTSVLRRASGPLCDALLERTDSHRLLERLCGANTFVTKTGDGWCSLHELLRLALLEQLERDDPDLVARLRDRAAAWHADSGDPEEAVHYSMESGLHDRTVHLMSRFTVLEHGSGRQATLDAWLDWAESNGRVGSDPGMATAGVLVSGLAGDPERSERWAAALHRAGGDRSPAEDPAAEGARSLVDAWQCRRGAAAMLVDATRACELIAEESPWRKSALGALAVAQMMNGLDDDSLPSLMEVAGVGEASARQDTNARSVAACFLVRRALAEHDLDAARRWLDHSVTIRLAGRISEQGLQALEDAVAARYALAVGSVIDEARRRLAHAQTVRPLTTWAMPGLALPVRLESIKAHLALGDLAAARVLLREASDILRHRPGLGAFEAEAIELRDRAAEQAETASGPSSLTAAELRLVPWLATHLSFREIGERLFLSTNTVKTEALSTYRKLGVSSRSEAVEAAVKAGLLDPASLPGILHASTWTASEPH
jgi:LuxR family maltose regulon positive regulatory protein